MINQKNGVYKILVLGDSKVGKSCLILRYTEDQFSEDFLTTIGVDFKVKNINIENQDYKLQIWDTAGQEQFRSITQSFYRNSHGVLVVFDLSDRESFESVPTWINSVVQSCESPINIILVGNKCDLDHVVSKEEAKDLASSFNIKYIETSAKNNLNVDEAFSCLAEDVIKNQTPKVTQEDIIIQPIEIDEKKKNNCC